MLEELFNLVKGASTETVVNNPDVPNEHNNAVIAEATNTVSPFDFVISFSELSCWYAWTMKHSLLRELNKTLSRQSRCIQQRYSMSC